MLTVLSNLVQYYVCRASQKIAAPFWERYGPALCIVTAAILLMVHPTSFLLKDFRFWVPTCKDKWGMRAIYSCTYTGFVSLAYGTIWAAFGGVGIPLDALRQKCLPL
mmetsp:Transcript_83566/g.240125  ORF Transcript_83566/g.240125 Transcript_83566/m.240125 type:complete len:107 (-) Transcript_83566:85-405(-)